MTPSHHLVAAITELREELRETRAHADKLDRAIKDLEDLVPHSHEAVDDKVPASPSGSESLLTSNGSHPTITRRPLLRDAIPEVLRANGEAMTIKALADELWRREWIGGASEDSRAEMVREALRTLKRVGIVTSEIPEGEKAAVWRLANVMLPRPPMYTFSEEASGI